MAPRAGAGSKKKGRRGGGPEAGLSIPHKRRFDPFRSIRNSFFTGVVVLTPVAVTGLLVVSFVTFVDNRVKPLIPKRYNPETYLQQWFPDLSSEFAIPGLGLLFAIAFVTIFGALAANFFGRIIVDLGDRLVNAVPLVRNIYGALKQLIATIVAQRETSFQEVVLIEYPRKGLFALGFITADAQGEIHGRLGDGMVGVFVPTTPNPTSGFLLYARREELRVLDMTVEEGAKLIISAGLVTPDHLAPKDAEAAVSEAAHEFAEDHGPRPATRPTGASDEPAPGPAEANPPKTGTG